MRACSMTSKYYIIINEHRQNNYSKIHFIIEMFKLKYLTELLWRTAVD
mgnify:CR=1 FL=1